jgi:hypothetical protein
LYYSGFTNLTNPAVRNWVESAVRDTTGFDISDDGGFSAAGVPEPAEGILLGVGLSVVGLFRYLGAGRRRPPGA